MVSLEMNKIIFNVWDYYILVGIWKFLELNNNVILDIKICRIKLKYVYGYL